MYLRLRPNGPELRCGGEPRRRGSHSARGMSSPIVAVCFARAKSSTAGSVNLSDWLGGDTCILIRTRFRTDSIILETISKDAIPSFWYLIK
jgi:hypothetical protein